MFGTLKKERCLKNYHYYFLLSWKRKETRRLWKQVRRGKGAAYQRLFFLFWQDTRSSNQSCQHNCTCRLVELDEVVIVRRRKIVITTEHIIFPCLVAVRDIPCFLCWSGRQYVELFFLTRIVFLGFLKKSASQYLPESFNIYFLQLMKLIVLPWQTFCWTLFFLVLQFEIWKGVFEEFRGSYLKFSTSGSRPRWRHAWLRRTRFFVPLKFSVVPRSSSANSSL